MVEPAWATPPAPDPWPAGERDRQVHGLRDVVAAQIKPAFGRLRAFLHDTVLPRARGDKEGLVGVPGGDACYRASILYHVGMPKTPDELHALGQAEIARTDREIAALGKSVLGTPDLAATIARLRGDRSLYFDSRDELLAAAGHALDRAKAAIPRFFSVLPRADCVMRETPAYEAPYSTIAYYRQPHYDGTKPGEYFVNTYKPETRPRFELEALTWHESIPGHHLQIAIASELQDVPEFRKHIHNSAYAEGWGLYTERLADEMGLYTAAVDRMGMFAADSMRACRLVVDTGLHALGWSRQQAIDYMVANSPLTEGVCRPEVDRYICNPGQATSYMIGRLEIQRMRAEAEQRQGDRFDITKFHSAVLESGSLPLDVLDQVVAARLP
jgi:uncharacterized protein (DUF885 family)